MVPLRRVYWDTMLFAYWLENNRQFAARVERIHESMSLRGDILCSSLFALAELLVHPVAAGDLAREKQLESFFYSSAVMLLEFSPGAPRLFAELRGIHRVKPIDAFHLSLAAGAQVDVFLTNDRRLHKVRMPGLPLVASLETDIF